MKLDTKNIRVVFFGTPDFAVDSLTALIDAHYDVVAVVTQPDKPVGRSQELMSSPVKKIAEAHIIPVLQPTTLRVHKASGKSFFDAFSSLRPDIAVVVAYGKIIPAEYLTVPHHGFVNVHGSLLPAFRGPSPIHAAIMAGLTETGVTIMQLDQGMDTGAMLSQATTPIDEHDTTATLHDTLKMLGSHLLVNTLPGYIDGSVRAQIQDESLATYCHIITKENGLLDLAADPQDIDRKVRAYTPWPGTYTIVNGKRVKILEVHVDGKALVIDRVQPEGKKAMPYSEYLKGHSPLM